MSQLPEPWREGAGPPAERQLSREEFENVIRRAAELQARAAEEPGSEGIAEGELLRIGRELGISGVHLNRALAEVRGQTAAAPRGALDRWIGEGAVAASRTVPGEAGQVLEHLERYLAARERLMVVRRSAGRMLLQRARGMDLVRAIEMATEIAGLGARQPVVGAGFKLRRARRVEVAAQQLEEGFCHLSLRVDLSPQRNGAATGAAAVGMGAGGMTAAFLAIAVDPVAALVGLPVLAGPFWGARALYANTREHAQLHLESLLDCLERGEPLVAPARPRR